MRDYRDAKAMAQTLRQALKERSVSLTHSESLELIAKVLGLADWNTLSARIDASPKVGPTVRKPVVPMRDLVLFPDMTSPIYAARLKSLAAIEQAMAADKEMFFVTQRRAADTDEARAEALRTRVVLVARRLVDLALAAVRGFVRKNRDAIALRGAIPATFAHRFVDHDALLRLGEFA